MGVKDQIQHMLCVHKIPETDIEYVIYASGKSREKHRCSLAEFFEVVKDVDWAFDLVFPYDIRLVGKRFWIDFDYRNEWMLHSFLEEKYTYMKPSSNIIRKKTFSDDDI